ncbi:hypothetical protein [Paraherbaspirillum soli]|uniref:Uncharacterized protein n=1 Tax=Paraherbaspirillum soli TaxID=631222 RepID=A0ABW0M670_9BURK
MSDVKRYILLIFIFCFFDYSNAEITSSLLSKAEKLPIEMRIVRNCGNWQYGNKNGYYRLIIGDVYDGAGSEIYVQWITNPTQEKKSELIKTLAFPELNDDHAQYYFKSVDCKKIGKSTYVKLKALLEHDQIDKVHNISIKLIDIGSYKIIEKNEK